jgi:hypothetical protein
MTCYTLMYCLYHFSGVLIIDVFSVLEAEGSGKHRHYGFAVLTSMLSTRKLVSPFGWYISLITTRLDEFTGRFQSFVSG